MKTFLSTIGLMILAALPAQADQWDALREDERVHNGLLVITIGAHIHETCPDIEARSIASMSFMIGLARHAMSLGYSRDELRAYIDDETERERYFNLARAYFAQNGVTSEEDVEGACRVGRQEIADRTPVGRLLH
ncbi:DUF5333 domain-containing protein [Nioella sp.]|jgi:hypothetical protein|uniref:DUF5333 domain-containing protein n=1 Tax=Nioella sp. TaxID=1912091 RepID=UPI003512D2F7